MAQKIVVLDTTFALPLFEFDVDTFEGTKDSFQKLWVEGIAGHKIILPSTCLLECFYKLNREARRSKDLAILNRFSANLPTIINSPIVGVLVPEQNPLISEIAIKLRQAGHPDLLDCLIAACASALGGIFLSEDGNLRPVMQQLAETRATPIWNWKQMLGILK